MKPLLILLIFCSCSASRMAQRKLAKADRLIKQAVALGATIKADTVFIEKVIPGAQTTVNVPIDRLIHHDTVIYQDRIRLQYRLLHDTLKLSVDCPPDTIRVPVTIHKAIVAPPCPKDRIWKGIGIGAGAVLLLLIILGLVRAIR